eukprot:m.51311 g.51311  ORF g.51311 m.51311 type:complete len:93 (+) comp13447_c0_seq35:262-540(+)
MARSLAKAAVVLDVFLTMIPAIFPGLQTLSQLESEGTQLCTPATFAPLLKSLKLSNPADSLVTSYSIYLAQQLSSQRPVDHQKPTSLHYSDS